MAKGKKKIKEKRSTMNLGNFALNYAVYNMKKWTHPGMCPFRYQAITLLIR